MLAEIGMCQEMALATRVGVLPAEPSNMGSDTMKLTKHLLAAASMSCLMASAAFGQGPIPVGSGAWDSAGVRAYERKARKPVRSRMERPEVQEVEHSRPAGTTNFDPAAAEADRAKKAATLARTERERTAHLKPGTTECVIKPVMTKADLALCNSN